MSLVAFTPVVDGATATAASVNTPLSTLYNDYNGNITDANVSASAAIAASKISFATAPTGLLVQQANALFSAVATGTTTIPYDDTIPQITEGDQYMTLAITPKATTNILVIQISMYVSNGTVPRIIAALFQDSTANALAANVVYQATAGGDSQLFITHTMTAGTTSATTFRVRAGGSGAGTTTFNGTSGTRFFGAITKSSMVITEFRG